MITQLKIGRSNLLAIRIEGKIGKKEIKTFVKGLLTEIKSTDGFNLYIELENIEDIELKSISKELNEGFESFEELLAKLDKVAVISDSSILRMFAEVEDSLFPEVDEKAFSFEEKEEALEWAIKK